MNEPAVCECLGVSRSFVSPAETVHALRSVDLVVAAGQFVCLYGASGCGKTTLINLLAGLDSPTEGCVRVLGNRLEVMRESERTALRLRRIGVVFQDNNLVPEFTALENVMLPLQAMGMDRPEALRQAAQALERVGLDQEQKRVPAELSGGQRQRVGIARALVGERDLLVADEPTGALDSANSKSLFDLISGLCSDGLTAIVASHDPQARLVADLTVELIDGAVASVG